MTGLLQVFSYLEKKKMESPTVKEIEAGKWGKFCNRLKKQIEQLAADAFKFCNNEIY